MNCNSNRMFLKKIFLNIFLRKYCQKHPPFNINETKENIAHLELKQLLLHWWVSKKIVVDKEELESEKKNTTRFFLCFNLMDSNQKDVEWYSFESIEE